MFPIRRWCTLVFTCAAACGPNPRRTSPESSSALRDTLIRLRAEDQAGRDSFATAFANHDTAFIRRLVRNDSARARWLQSVVAERGWPRRSVVGDTAADAAFLIVQHSPIEAFQEQMLPVLQEEAKHGEANAANVAMLFDRVRVKKNGVQRYGTQFSVKGGKLVPDSIADLTELDSLRASVGLPPMTEYVRMLAQMYRLPVEWPPARSKSRP